MPGKLKSILEVFATVLLMIAAGMFIWTQVESRLLRVRTKPQFQKAKSLTITTSAIETQRERPGWSSYGLRVPFCIVTRRRDPL